jgi:hypothetical protein
MIPHTSVERDDSSIFRSANVTDQRLRVNGVAHQQ